MWERMGTGTIVTDANYRRVAAAILARAVLDALASDPGLAAPARRWLRTAGVDLAEQLDIPPGRVMTWVGELPGLPWEQLRLFE